MASNGLFGKDLVLAGWYELTAAEWFDESLIGPPASGGGSVALTATGIVTGAPTLGTPALRQRHVLVAVGVQTSAPTLGAPTLAQRHVLLAAGVVTGAPTLATAVFAQRHALSGAGLATAAATLGTPALGAAGSIALSAAGLDAGAPVLDTPALSQTSPAVAETPDASPRGLLNVFTPQPIAARPARAVALSPRGLHAAPATLGRPGFRAALGRQQVRRQRAVAVLLA